VAEHSPPASVALMAGDVVEVKFFYTPQLNEIQTVRPDGKIALQLVGEVEAQERTPVELQTELVRLYTPYLKGPDITVIVRSFFNRRVFVGGQVMKPGVVGMPGKLTALEAIIQAGGFDMRDAELRNIIVIRHKNGQRYAYSLNMKSLQKEGEIQPFYLEQQDVVYVPQTEIARVDQWVDQHINKLIPRTGFIFLTTEGTNTIGINTSSQ
jgi:protein involved in polysaccharide export with SLBB domain